MKNANTKKLSSLLSTGFSVDAKTKCRIEEKWQQKKFFVTRWWFNAMPFTNLNKMTNVEWTYWCGMFFRKSIFDEWFRFEKKFMKYSLMEDCFLSYWIQQKYPNSLYYIPSVKLIHCESTASRIANKQRIYQNIIHRYYFVKKFDKDFLAYLWTMSVFSISDFIQFKSFKVFGWYYKWLNYVKKNRKNIWNLVNQMLSQNHLAP